MKNTLVLLVFLGVGLISFSQNAHIVGNVIDIVEDNNLSNVSVSISETKFVASTDPNGKFIFKDGELPIGRQVLMFSKQGYETLLVPIQVVEGKQLVISNPIELLITDEERKERNRLKKEVGEMPIDKGWFKKKRKEDQSHEISYEEMPEELPKEQEKLIKLPAKKYTLLQLKYAELLGVSPERINSEKLYEFVDEWMGTPYLMGGNNKNGIDCSSFTLSLFGEVYGHFNIGRTAKQQLKEAVNRNRAFGDPQHLEEGDLVFFGNPGENNYNINHVGVYLGNGKFINSTARRGPSGISGVKISDLKEPFWQQRVRGFGRW